MLGETGATHEDIATVLGVSRVSVTNWISGKQKPGRLNRQRLLTRYQIPVASWDRYPRLRDTVKNSGLTALPVMSAEVRAKDQLSRIDAARRELIETGKVTPQIEVRLLEREIKVNAQLAKITGEGSDISVPKILKSSAWRRVVECVVKALRGYPEASLRMTEALKELESE